MNTLLLDASNAVDHQRALELLRMGELVAVPTETVYGLAADARQPAAVTKIFAAKNRPANHPLIVHIASASCLVEWATPIPQIAYQLAEAFWPGPLTLLLPKAPHVNTVVTGGRDTIALRMPDHPMLLQLLRELKSGVAAPSANPHKQLSPTSAAQVMSVLSGRIAAVLDGGDCRVGLESTIVDLTHATPQILRSGPITRQQLEDVLGISVLLPDRHDVSVPGNMQVHYQPRAPLFVMTRAHLVQYAKQHASDKLAMLVLGERPLDLQLCHNATVATLPTDKSLYAAALYRSLFEMDSLKPSAILLEQPPTSEEWLDVNDRLSKAATSWQR